MKCRFCRHELTHEFIDLVNAPPSNSFLTKQQLNEPEVFYPLKIFVCEKCFLVQIAEYKKSQEIFSDQYIYFSSFSKTWLKHARRYADMITDYVTLNKESLVIEIGSNDGYLLQYFRAKGISCLGIEPAGATAEKASKKGIQVITKFFGTSLARQLRAEDRRADLLIGNNVLAHVPEINDFVEGLRIVLKHNGTITLEFPHLMRLVQESQFDTIYHEHFSYLSFHTAKAIFDTHGLEIFEVEKLPTHGGSLRVYLKHQKDRTRRISANVQALLTREFSIGMNKLAYYQGFQLKANKVKYALLSFLLEEVQRGKKVVGYGAAAKGNTLLNYCGLKKDVVKFVVDASPHKQNRFLPGNHIPVLPEEYLSKTEPDYVLILPWNIKSEIMNQLSYVRAWGAKFIIPIPRLSVI